MTAAEISQIITGVVTLGVAYIGYLRIKATTASKSDVHDVKADVAGVHTLVNNQLDRQLQYNGQLAAALTAAGQDVPQQETAPPAG
jgi:hypothetical protein